MRKQVLKTIGLASIAFLSIGLTSCGQGDAPASFKEDEVQAKMDNLANGNGYEITLKIESNYAETENTEITFGVKGGYHWMITSEGGSAFEVRTSEEYGDCYLFYTNTNDEWTYQAAYTATLGESLSKLSDLYGTLLVTVSTSMPEMTYKYSENVAGRDCWVYEASASSEGNSGKGKIYIDKEYNICLKMEAEGTSGGQTLTGNMEVTNFNTNPSLPSFPTVEEYTPTDSLF